MQKRRASLAAKQRAETVEVTVRASPVQDHGPAAVSPQPGQDVAVDQQGTAAVPRDLQFVPSQQVDRTKTGKHAPIAKPLRDEVDYGALFAGRHDQRRRPGLLVAGRPPGVLFGHDASEAPQRRAHPGKAKRLQSLLERGRLSPRIRTDQLVQDAVSAAPATQQLVVDIGQRSLFGLGAPQSAVEFEHRCPFFEL